MTESFLIAIPLIVVATVALLAFTGCGLPTQGTGDEAPGGTATRDACVAVTGPATNVGSTQATLTGTVNPSGLAVEYWFQYSNLPQAQWGANWGAVLFTTPASLGSGFDDVDVAEVITGLDVDTDYYFRLVAAAGEEHSCAGDPAQMLHTQPLSVPPQSYHEVIDANPDLLAYWRLNETSGTTAFDSGPAGHDGDYVGGVTLGQPGAITGDPDFAVEFDGVDAQVKVENGPVLSGACSIEGWFFWTGGRALLTDDASGGAGWRFAFENNGNLAYRFAGTDFDTGIAVASVQNAWHHFVATKDDVGNVAFYLDGASTPIPTGSGADTTPTQMPWHLMRDQPSGDYTAGRADEVAIYGAVLDPGEVQEHFQKGKFG